jgi:hypothetical protein
MPIYDKVVNYTVLEFIRLPPSKYIKVFKECRQVQYYLGS